MMVRSVDVRMRLRHFLHDLDRRIEEDVNDRELVLWIIKWLRRFIGEYNYHLKFNRQEEPIELEDLLK